MDEATQVKNPTPVCDAPATHRCPHCKALNTFPCFAEIDVYICPACGKPVDASATNVAN